MNDLIWGIVIGTGVAAAAAGLAAPARAEGPANAPTVPLPGATTSSDNAQTVMSQLASNGYEVNVTRVGAAALDQCTVSAITPKQQVTSLGHDFHGRTWVSRHIVAVTANCTSSPGH